MICVTAVKMVIVCLLEIDMLTVDQSTREICIFFIRAVQCTVSFLTICVFCKEAMAARIDENHSRILTRVPCKVLLSGRRLKSTVAIFGDHLSSYWCR